ncbi:16S rRNA (guanine(966)-N(2))-methyltransferase RsmD [Robbsia andropogonis]|uniref:16S rRNA (guanine(966)-N(2))-methyltransferase RsmD n=1 Tax=Robbsia andropogonis TaxID=28092 RepID=UPI003D2524BA
MPRSSSFGATPSRAGSPASKVGGAAVTRPRGVAQQVRIIGGMWKRTPLAVIDAEGLRPTPDRVRETLFNWLGQDLNGWRCIDVFAGSGALGFEAASRGAAQVRLIERHPRVAAQLRAVKDKLEARGVEVLEADGARLLSSMAPGSADLVFLDPPFDSGALPSALLAASRVCAPQGLIYVEAPVPLAPLPVKKKGPASLTLDPESPLARAWSGLMQEEGWEVSRQGVAGAVHYHLLQRNTTT